MSIRHWILLGSAITVTMLASCKKEESTPTPTTPTETKSSFKLEFEHTFGDSAFQLSKQFTTAANEQVNFSVFKYYISNVKLQKTDGTWWSDTSYYLIDASQANSNVLTINNVPSGDYKAVQYVIGVDSARNTSGAQTGSLDPANGMFWSWNTGYIFIKAEGSCPQAGSGTFKYHIGGFKGSTVAIQKNEHSFGSGNYLRVRHGATPQVHLALNVRNMFNGWTIAGLPEIHMPGGNAQTVSIKFKEAISFEHIHN
ncbi:MAG: hypothetical protein NZ108_05550 [Bacteroidia bacterium]|nr:hypothetical protein [Bacteroidia bacterium]